MKNNSSQSNSKSEDTQELANTVANLKLDGERYSLYQPTSEPPQDTSLDDFTKELIAPFSIHRAKYSVPHGTVARKQFANRVNKQVKALLAQERAKLFEQIRSEVIDATEEPRKSLRYISREAVFYEQREALTRLESKDE